MTKNSSSKNRAEIIAEGEAAAAGPRKHYAIEQGMAKAAERMKAQSDDEIHVRDAIRGEGDYMRSSGQTIANLSNAGDAENLLSSAYYHAVAVERVTLRAVVLARMEGMSWQRIGDMLHVSKQAAQQRYGKEVEISLGRVRNGMMFSD